MTTPPSAVPDTPRSSGPPGCMVFAFVFATACIAAAFALLSTTLVQQHLMLRRSVPVRAVIESTAVVADHKWRNSPQSYTPVVVYHYEMQGRSYRGDAIQPLTQLKATSPQEGEAIAFAYHVRDTVTAWADPEQPDRAFLRRRAIGFTGPFFVGLVLLGALLVTRRAWRDWRRT